MLTVSVSCVSPFLIAMTLLNIYVLCLKRTNQLVFVRLPACFIYEVVNRILMGFGICGSAPELAL